MTNPMTPEQVVAVMRGFRAEMEGAIESASHWRHDSQSWWEEGDGAFHIYIAPVLARIDAALSTVEAMAADVKRLDWLVRNEAETVFTGDDAPGGWCVRYGPISVSTMRKSRRADAETLREALDAARATTEET